MKKLCLILAIVFAFCGCFAEEPEILNSNPEEGYTNPKIPSLIPGSGYQSMPPKIFLPLINFTENELKVPDNAEIFGTRVEIPVVLPENSGEVGPSGEAEISELSQSRSGYEGATPGI